MDERDVLARRFEGHRAHLKAVAYSMLGSLTESDDAVQEAWLRLERAGDGGIGNLGGWLTTVVGRICLDMLRARRLRREEPFGSRLPDPVISGEGADPERQALMAEAVGWALMVVLESLNPAERVALVLHDVFDLRFEQIAAILDRTPVAARKLASRARVRVRGALAEPEADPVAQRRAVDAFVAAAGSGDFEALLAILDPGVVLRGDSGKAAAGGLRVLIGAEAVAGQALTFQRMALACVTRPALVNGAAGLVNSMDGALYSIIVFTVVRGRIVAIDMVSGPGRLARLDPAGLPAGDQGAPIATR
ncbi:sigma-70 family RNA polymerase sigma factor [Nonomuraea sp. NPDC050404]|uniref:sigma-70 family RNA polymerase sigma factor n=1 Tax=Nonomuraea sp. NPDC050404 TaxID=3155783 RepID=UPI00340A4740